MNKNLNIKILKRYAIFQLPSLLLVVIISNVLAIWFDWPWWIPVVFVMFWMLKDIAMFPFVRHSYAINESETDKKMINKIGISTERIENEGYARFGSELWKVRLVDSKHPLLKNETVRVLAQDGLILIVQPVTEKSVKISKRQN